MHRIARRTFAILSGCTFLLSLYSVAIYSGASQSELTRQVVIASDPYSQLAHICLSNVTSNSGLNSCENRLSAAVPAVACEVQRSMLGSNDPFNATLLTPCVPRIKRINCTELKEATLPCLQDFEFEEFDYSTQHHCIADLADKIVGYGNGSIPRILHFIWYYDRQEQLKFHSYLGITSTVRFLSAKAVFFWNDGSFPSNKWWQELIGHFNQAPNLEELTNGTTFEYLEQTAYVGANGRQIPARKLHLFGHCKFYSIFRRRPSQIYGNEIGQEYHKSDVTRLDALLLYGGLYIDTDVVSVRDLTPLLSHEVVMGREASASVPTIGNAIIFASRNSSYMNLWHHTYRSFVKSEWAEHSTIGNNLLVNQCPQFVHIEDSSLMKPGDHNLLYYRDSSLASNFMLHLWMRWRSDGHSVNGPEDLVDWQCTVGRILRGLYFGTCDVCG